MTGIVERAFCFVNGVLRVFGSAKRPVGQRGTPRARWWVLSCSQSGLALGSLGFAAGTKGRLAAPGQGWPLDPLAFVGAIAADLELILALAFWTAGRTPSHVLMCLKTSHFVSSPGSLVGSVV